MYQHSLSVCVCFCVFVLHPPASVYTSALLYQLGALPAFSNSPPHLHTQAADRYCCNHSSLSSVIWTVEGFSRLLHFCKLQQLCFSFWIYNRSITPVVRKKVFSDPCCQSFIYMSISRICKSATQGQCGVKCKVCVLLLNNHHPLRASSGKPLSLHISRVLNDHPSFCVTFSLSF